MPVAAGSVDVIISNCVINLSPNKERVFEEVYRVLKNGGRLVISEIVLTANLPDKIKSDMQLYSCVLGASAIEQLYELMEQAGFKISPLSQKMSQKNLSKNGILAEGSKNTLFQQSSKQRSKCTSHGARGEMR